MIKLLGFLFPFALLLGNETFFLLPDDQSRMLAFLSESLRKSDDPVLVATPRLHLPELNKLLVKAARNGSRVTLLLSDPQGDPLNLIQYRGIELLLYRARPMEGSVLLIGKRSVCTFPIPLVSEAAESEAALVRCSEEASEARKALIPLLRRSRPYLE
ncbi:MAG: hypothetical protein AB1763_01950 [Campylobacterota bacterium]